MSENPEQSAADEHEDSAGEGPREASDYPPEQSGGHLGDLPDGCGCVEVWEALSGERTPAGQD